MDFDSNVFIVLYKNGRVLGISKSHVFSQVGGNVSL